MYVRKDQSIKLILRDGNGLAGKAADGESHGVPFDFAGQARGSTGSEIAAMGHIGYGSH